MPLWLGRVLQHSYSGSPLHESGRKILVISWSFREFGRRVLTSSAAWFTTCVVRSTTASLMPGRMSGILLHLIRNHFLGPQGMWIAGAPNEIDGNITMLFAKFSNQLADGDGWKQTLQAKGAAAIRCCPKCKNIVSHKSGLSVHGAGVRDITCARPQDFQLHTWEAIWNDIAALFGY